MKKQIRKSDVKLLVVQFSKFGIVGCINTATGYCIYLFCIYILGLHYIVANIIEFLITIFISYVLNSWFVFSKREISWKQRLISLGKTYMSYISTGLILSSFLLAFWVEKIKISEALAPILNLLVTVPLNFILNKFWVYNKKDELK